MALPFPLLQMRTEARVATEASLLTSVLHSFPLFFILLSLFKLLILDLFYFASQFWNKFSSTSQVTPQTTLFL